MRQFPSILLVLTLVLCAVPSQAQTKRRTTHPPQTTAEQRQQLDDDRVAIQKLHDKDIEASLALDVPKLEALWTDDIVTMAPGGTAVVGREANDKKLEAGADGLKSMEILAFDEQWQEIRIQGDWAYEYGTMSGRMRPFSGGNEISYVMNVMRILNRQPDGTWKIARSIYNDAKEAPKPPEPKPEEKKKDPLKD